MAIQIDYNDPRYAQAAAEILRRHDNGEPEANITSAVRDFLILTGLASGEEMVEENPPAQGSRRAVDLTALDTFIEFKLNGEDVSGRGVFTVELERFDPRTGAALLTIEAEDLAVAPRYRGRVAHGEPVLLLLRDEDGGELVVKETFASPSLNAPDHLFALHRDYTPSYQRWAPSVRGH